MNKYKYKTGGGMKDQHVSSAGFKVQGNPQKTDGNYYPEFDALLDHNEVVINMEDGPFVFSDSLHPNDDLTMKSYAKMATPHVKALKQAEKILERSKYDEQAKSTVQKSYAILKTLRASQEELANRKGLRNPDGTPTQEGDIPAMNNGGPRYGQPGSLNYMGNPSLYPPLESPYSNEYRAEQNRIAADYLKFYGNRYHPPMTIKDDGFDAWYYEGPSGSIPYNPGMTDAEADARYEHNRKVTESGSRLAKYYGHEPWKVPLPAGFDQPPIGPNQMPRALGPAEDSPDDLFDPQTIDLVTGLPAYRGIGPANPDANPTGLRGVNVIDEGMQDILAAGGDELAAQRSRAAAKERERMNTYGAQNYTTNSPEEQAAMRRRFAESDPNRKATMTFPEPRERQRRGLTKDPFKTPWTFGDYLKVGELVGKFSETLKPAEVEMPFYDNSRITRQVMDPTRATAQVRNQFANARNSMDFRNPAARAAATNQMLSNVINAESDIATRYQQANQQNLANYETRVAEQNRFNTLERARVSDINSRNRAALDQARQNVFTSVGQFGEDLNRKYYADQQLEMLRKIFPEGSASMTGAKDPATPATPAAPATPATSETLNYMGLGLDPSSPFYGKGTRFLPQENSGLFGTPTFGFATPVPGKAEDYDVKSYYIGNTYPRNVLSTATPKDQPVGKLSNYGEVSEELRRQGLYTTDPKTGAFVPNEAKFDQGLTRQEQSFKDPKNVMSFQQEYNKLIKAGSLQGTYLDVDGKNGPETKKAWKAYKEASKQAFKSGMLRQRAAEPVSPLPSRNLPYLSVSQPVESVLPSSLLSSLRTRRYGGKLKKKQ